MKREREGQILHQFHVSQMCVVGNIVSVQMFFLPPSVSRLVLCVVYRISHVCVPVSFPFRSRNPVLFLLVFLFWMNVNERKRKGFKK